MALIVTPVVTAFFGIILERFFIRWAHAFGHIGEMILTVGFFLIILAAVKIFWSTENLPVKVPPLLDGLAYFWGMDYTPGYRVGILFPSPDFYLRFLECHPLATLIDFLQIIIGYDR